MNAYGRYRPQPLKHCPICGMDSGARKMTTRVPEKFLIVCECCGFKTKLRDTPGGATSEWNRYKRCNDED